MRSAARALWLAGAVAACTPAPHPMPAAGPVCRVGPDGEPLVAERGIGGTGALPIQVAERGIGGTGIIGVVTGFASICLAGHEVALPADVPVEIAGVAAAQHALRAGQVAAVEAAGPADALYARRVSVRYEVQGPVETVAPDRLQVAGQAVLLSAATWMRTTPAPGQWVAVSGLRDVTGAIAATRLDLVSTRTFILNGVVQQEAGGYRVGALPVLAKPGAVLVPGLPVSITGVYDQGTLRAASAAPDLLAADPVAYFGSAATSFVFEGFGRSAEGRPSFGMLPTPPATASIRSLGAGRSVMEFQRTGHGSARPGPVPPAGRTFEPAPVPNRSLGFGAVSGASGGARNRFGSSGRGQGARPASGGGAGDAAPGPGGEGGGRRR